jgi:hypothetical protein
VSHLNHCGIGIGIFAIELFGLERIGFSSVPATRGVTQAGKTFDASVFHRYFVRVNCNLNLNLLLNALLLRRAAVGF